MKALQLLSGQYDWIKRVRLPGRHWLPARNSPWTCGNPSGRDPGPTDSRTSNDTRPTPKKRDRDHRRCRDSKAPGGYGAWTGEERQRPKSSKTSRREATPPALDGGTSLEYPTGALDLYLPLKSTRAALDFNLTIDAATARASDLGVPFDHLGAKQGCRRIAQPEQAEQDAESRRVDHRTPPCAPETRETPARRPSMRDDGLASLRVNSQTRIEIRRAKRNPPARLD
jgi:hypothetical protein